MEVRNLGKRTVCLLGPRDGGKSSLLRTFRECLLRNGHGYSVDAFERFDVRDIDEIEFSSGPADAFEQLMVRFPKAAGNFIDEEVIFTQAEANATANGPIGKSTGIEEIFPYYFSLRCVSADTEPSFGCRLRIIDSAGEVSAAYKYSGDGTEERLNESRGKLDSSLLEADGLVVVIPPANNQPEPWAATLFEALNRLVKAQSKTPRLKRIIIVFSKYDRLFSECGKDAADWAIKSEVMNYAIGRELLHRPWARRLWELVGALKKSERNIEVLITAASALGFTRRFGTPNHDPNPDHPHGLDAYRGKGDAYPKRFRAGSASDDYNSLWRPFLTADPFIYAATGLSTDYMMPFEEFAHVEQISPDEAAGLAEPEPAFAEEQNLHPEPGSQPADATEKRPPEPQPSLYDRVKMVVKTTFDASSNG